MHERHLSTDCLLALLRALLLQRPELRVVLMSATINCQVFSQYFGGAPIVTVRQTQAPRCCCRCRCALSAMVWVGACMGKGAAGADRRVMRAP